MGLGCWEYFLFWVVLVQGGILFFVFHLGVSVSCKNVFFHFAGQFVMDGSIHVCYHELDYSTKGAL